jgi:hypothetical protein
MTCFEDVLLRAYALGQTVKEIEVSGGDRIKARAEWIEFRNGLPEHESIQAEKSYYDGYRLQ